MKFIGKLIIYLLLALLVVVLAFYILLQTRWGASQVSNWVTVNTDYQVGSLAAATCHSLQWLL